MPKNQFQRMIFALLTVVITVHAYVFYSLYVINGSTLMSVTGADSVIHAIQTQGGVYMFGRMMPVWALILIEFCFAYALECVLGSPCSFKIAMKHFDPAKTHPDLFEAVVISATVALMVPVMSFLASLFYYPYYNGFHLLTLLANWLKLMCYNFPFAFFSQLFFIQPLVRVIFGFLFRKSIAGDGAGQAENFGEAIPQGSM
ncbi:MAG: hypothetical protein LUE29_13725 [Lachnospiraceae bacterium]|nr:hypothetical protein [Lachnospiraceae bacterium]